MLCIAWQPDYKITLPVRDKVGKLEDKAENVQKCRNLMTGELSMYFSLVFTREYYMVVEKERNSGSP